jgi:hypothetical protein
MGPAVTCTVCGPLFIGRCPHLPQPEALQPDRPDIFAAIEGLHADVTYWKSQAAAHKAQSLRWEDIARGLQRQLDLVKGMRELEPF